jgi:PDZ domain-containing protein
MKSLTFSIVALTLVASGLSPAAVRADDPAYLGVVLAPIPEELSAHLKSAEGALVQKVMPGSPADKAGLKRFDVIVSLNGAEAKSPDQVRGRIQEAKPGDVVKLGVMRGTDTLDLSATLAMPPAELPEARPGLKEPEQEEEKHAESKKGFLGIGPADVPAVLASHLGLGDGVGVVAGDVWKDSPAQKAGIEAKDVLTAIDGKEIHGSADFLKALSTRKAGETVEIDLIHQGGKKTVEVTLAPRPKDLPHTGWGMPLRDGRDYLGPRSSHKGKVILQGPDGNQHVIPLPESLWKAEDLFKDLEDQIGQFKDVQIPQLKRSLRESLREMEEKLKDEKNMLPPGLQGDAGHSSHSSVSTFVNGDHEITIKDQDGVRTVTVLKGGQAIATDLPYEKLDTLPQDVQDRVKQMAKSMKAFPGPKNPALPGEDSKIRA